MKNLDCYIEFLEVSIKEKEYPINALGEKKFKLEEELSHFKSIVQKLMFDTQKQDEILSNN